MATLVVLSALRWDAVLQRTRHLLVRLAHHHRILFVEPGLQAAPGVERVGPADGLVVLRPDAASAAAEPPFGRALAHELRAECGADDVVAWCCTPLAWPLARELRPRVVVYDCIDDAPAGAPARKLEQALLKAADIVFVSGPGLYHARRHRHHPRLHLLPSALDVAHFAPERVTAWHDEYLAAERLQGHVVAPRLGYFGIVDDRIDVDLLATLAARRRGWHFVMAGPVIGVEPPSQPNIHWLGAQPFRRLPALVAGWDVCLLPFALGRDQRFFSASNMLEYLAAEKPVVATALGDIAPLVGDIVRIGRDAPSFEQACNAALRETPEQREDRIARSVQCVAGFSWDDTARTVLRLIDEALERAARRTASRVVATASLAIDPA
jgi:glycosyltransferase involved in cell wall biosynthesis